MKKIFTLILLFAVTVFYSQNTITVEILTDAYSDTENAWTITNGSGTVVASDSTFAEETLTSDDFDVPNGCYTFTLTDSYGDGIAGWNGSPAGYLNVYFNGVYVGGYTTANANFGSEFVIYGIGNACTEIDAAAISVNTDQYQAVGSTANITGTVQNIGDVAITSFDVSYNVNGGAESAVQSFNGVNIGLGATFNFSHNVPYTFNTEGLNTVNLTVSNVNGGGETDLGDNTYSQDITVYSASVQRGVIIENFTTGVCPNCPPVHTMIENYAASNDDAIVIAQHAGYYTDSMTIPENTQLLAFYNDGGGTYAPAMMIDRYHYPTSVTGGAPDPGPVFFPSGGSAPTYQRLNDKIATPAFIEVEVYGEVNGNNLELDITGELLADVSATELRLVVYLTEDGIIAAQSGQSNPNYVHNDVMRDAVSDTWGDAVIGGTTSGTTFSQHYSYTLNGSWVQSNLKVVAFVANFDAGNINNRAIFNAEEKHLADLEVLSTDDINFTNVNVYPNPAKAQFTIANAEGLDISLYSVLGQEVLRKNNISLNEVIQTNHLTEGTYFLKISSENASTTEKIVIMK